MNRVLAAATLLFILLCFAVRNLPWHLDDYDQAKQAFTSLEMVEEGNWWFQHTPSWDIATKPPLSGWISAALYAVTRSWEVAWRLPVFASALIILAFLAGGALRLCSRIWYEGGTSYCETQGEPVRSATVVVAVAAFGLNLFVPRLATLVRTDMLLTLFIFLAGCIILEKVRTGAPWQSRDRWLLALVLLGSMLTKGPIAFAFLLPGVVAFAFLARRRRWPQYAWPGWWPWLLPLGVFLLWAGLGCWMSREFYEEVVLKEFLGRFTVGAKAEHNNLPPGAYSLKMLAQWAPWSVLLIGMLSLKNLRAAIWDRRDLLWLACWAGGGLLFMECVPSKRFDRILPVLPPLCLLLGALVAAWNSPRRTALLSAAIVVAMTLTGAYTGAKVWKAYRTDQRTLVRFSEEVRALAQQRGWRYGVIKIKDEGLLPYLRRARVTEDADGKWRRGEIDALVISEGALQKSAEEFAPYDVVLESRPAPEKDSRYFFIARKEADATGPR